MRILIPVDGSIPSRSVLKFVSDRASLMPQDLLRMEVRCIRT